MKRKAKQSGSGGRLRLGLLLAIAAALLLVPAVQASAAEPKLNVNIFAQPGASGEVISDPGSPAFMGEPPIACSYPVGGPQGGVCENEMAEPEKGAFAAALKAKLGPGTAFEKWEVVKPGIVATGCKSASLCVPATEGEDIEVNVYFANEVTELRVNIISIKGGGGEVFSPSEAAPFPGTPPIACLLEEGQTETIDVCENEMEELEPGAFGVSLGRVPGPNSVFKKWEVLPPGIVAGGCGGTEGSCIVATEGKDVEVNATFECTVAECPPPKPKHPLTVTKSGSGSGTVTSSPPGINCGVDCDEEYTEGTEVTLSAEAAVGSEFTGWSGSGCSGTGSCEVTMSAAKEVTANFDEEAGPEGPPLTLNIEEGQGTVVSDPAGLECSGAAPKSCLTEAIEAGSVLLTASPAAGYTFLSWKYCDKGGVNGRQCTISLSEAKTVGARFAKTWQLSASKAGAGLGKVQTSPGGILCLFSCSETTAAFREGTEVLVKQTPAKHFHFAEWLGDCTGSGACEVTMGEDHAVEALFAEDPKHLLTLVKSGGGQGTVKSSLAGINCGAVCSEQASAYYQGEVVELTAIPGKGSAFGGWTGAGCSGAGSCTVTMSEAKSVEAEFK